MVLMYVREYAEKQSRCIDVGCGIGEYLEDTVRKGFEAVGVDVSLPNIIQASKRAPEALVLLSDGQHLPFQDKSFPLALCIEVLEHIRNSDKVLQEIHRVLNDKGIFILSIPTSGIYRRILSMIGVHARYYLSPEHVREYSIFEGQGFESLQKFCRKLTEQYDIIQSFGVFLFDSPMVDGLLIRWPIFQRVFNVLEERLSILSPFKYICRYFVITLRRRSSANESVSM